MYSYVTMAELENKSNCRRDLERDKSNLGGVFQRPNHILGAEASTGATAIIHEEVPEQRCARVELLDIHPREELWRPFARVERGLDGWLGHLEHSPTRTPVVP